MHLHLSIHLSILLALLFCQSAVAQTSMEDNVDRPFQRWLPIPSGDQTEFSQQAEMLKQLRDSFSSAADGTSDAAPPGELSPEQLRKIDEAVEMWRDVAGDQPLPDLSNVPQEWLRALPDQQTRNQAQQLLEQYARQRKLPATDNRSADSNRIQLPNSNAGSSPQNPNRPASSSTKPQNRTDAESAMAPKPDNGIRQNPNNSNDSQSRQAPEPGNPLSPENLESLKKLFQELSSAAKPDSKNGQSGESPQSKPIGRDASSRLPGAPGDLPGANAGAGRNTPATADPKPTPETTPQPSISNRSSSTLRPQPARTQAEESSNRNDSNTSSRTVEAQPSGEAVPRKPFEDPFSDSSMRPDSDGQPRLERPEPPQQKANSTSGGLRDSEPKRGNKASDRNRSKPAETQPDSSGTQVSPPKPDIRTQVDRWGLGATLRGIVERTLKEQGADEDPSSIIQSIQELANKKSDKRPPPAQSSKQSPKPPTSLLPSGKLPTSSIAPRNGSSPDRNSGNRTANSANNNADNSDSFAGLAQDFWKAVSSPPNRGAENSSAAAAANGSALESGWSFRVGWREWAVLFVAFCLCGIMVYVARVRLKSFEPAIVDAREVAEMLKSGIHGRADVVRVFHRCVLGRPYSASSWWTHNFIAQRIRTATPQLSIAIQELANIYEQARYLPNHVELSSEQLQQARVALQDLASSNA